MTLLPLGRTVRPLLVWVVATAGAALLGWVLAGSLLSAYAPAGGAGSAGAVGAVTALCHVLLLACTAWAWASASAVVLGVLRQRPPRRVTGTPHAWRRLVLLACGGALSLGVAVPAHAVTSAGDQGSADPRPTPAQVAATILPDLDGLPLPRRPATSGVVAAPTEVAGAAATPAPARVRTPAAQPRDVVVRPGDTLWAIAAADLGPSAGTTAVARHCEQLHRLNRAVVGDDPDLVLPGQQLRLP